MLNKPKLGFYNDINSWPCFLHFESVSVKPANKDKLLVKKTKNLCCEHEENSTLASILSSRAPISCISFLSSVPML